MRIGEYKQINTRYEEMQMLALDEEGNETGEFQTIRREIPVMGMVYRDATDEEIAEAERMQAEMPVEPPTEMEILSAKLDALLEYQGLKLKAIDDRTFEVVKGEVTEGDYTNPILIPVDGIVTEVGKWYYVTDKDLPHEALQNAFVIRENFDDRSWFDFI